MNDRVGIKIVIFTKNKDFINSVKNGSYLLDRVSKRLHDSINKNIENYIGGDTLYSPKSVDIDATDSIKQKSRLDMVNDLQNRIKKSKAKCEIEIFSNDPLFYFLEYGTGLFGPENKEIVAKEVGLHKKMFRFEIDGEIIYAPKTKGMHPVPILRSSLLKLKVDLKKIMPKMGLKYKSYQKADREELVIEIMEMTPKFQKKGIIDSISWLTKYGERLKKL